MIVNSCPTPTKRQKVVVSLSESEESDELNLSSTFDQTYQTLMKDEIVKICLKEYSSTENLNDESNLSEFMRRCDEVQLWMETSWSQSRGQPLCRSDYYLERIIQGRQLLQSSRFCNIKMLSKMITSVEPHVASTVNIKIESLERQCQSQCLFSEFNLPGVLDDINEDIHDLSLWLNDVNQKLNFDLEPCNKKTNVDFVEFVLRDIDVHNKISLSLIKLISELQDLTSSYQDSINVTKFSMDSVESHLYQLWLKTLEYKQILEEEPRHIYNRLHPGFVGVIGHESGFESELSPRNNVRRLDTINITMKDISSGDNISDHTTDLPSDSETAVISIDKAKFSTSTLNSSTENMPQICDVLSVAKVELQHSKKVLRRKKRQSRRHDNISYFNVSTEESETGKTFVKNILKRRMKEVTSPQISEIVRHSPQSLNYAEIADVAERLVRKSTSLAENSTFESPKESEIEDVLKIHKRRINDIDLEKTWDYYQAPMYSNEEGDSQIIEVDKIKEWEPETDSDDIDALITADSSLVIPENRLLMLTSGYETSMESDPTTCSKSIICVLQFSTVHYHDVDGKINAVNVNMGHDSSSSYDQMLSTLNECGSETEIHIKLIRHILNFEPCYISHNTALKDNLVIMEKRWIRIKTKCIRSQLRLIEDQLEALKYYRDVEDLRSSINLLTEMTTTFCDVKKKLSLTLEVKDILWENIGRIDAALLNLKKCKCRQLDVVLHGLTCVAQSKCTRKLFGCELHLSKEVSCGDLNVQEVYDKFEKCILSLKTCMENLDSISSNECRVQLSTTIEHEISLWQTLCEKANLMSPLTVISPEEINTLEECQRLESRHPPRSRLFRHLPMHVAIVAVVVMLGWWYNQSSMGDCRSSSTNWIQLFYKFKNQLEPY